MAATAQPYVHLPSHFPSGQHWLTFSPFFKKNENSLPKLQVKNLRIGLRGMLLWQHHAADRQRRNLLHP